MTEQQIRADEREKCCRDVCARCAFDVEVKRMFRLGFFSDIVGWRHEDEWCDASNIRERVYQEEKQTNDASLLQDM